jgi:hypothetical protein
MIDREYYQRGGSIMRSTLALVLLLCSGCTDAGLRPSATITTTSPAWEHWFKIDWALEADPSGAKRISGWVNNTYGETATEVELLAQALDKQGTVLQSRIFHAGAVAPMSRRSFEVRNLPEADQYRVTVWAFTFRQGHSFP